MTNVPLITRAYAEQLARQNARRRQRSNQTKNSSRHNQRQTLSHHHPQNIALFAPISNVPARSNIDIGHGNDRANKVDGVGISNVVKAEFGARPNRNGRRSSALA